MKRLISRNKGIYIIFFLLLFLVQRSFFVANAEVSLPNPSLPSPSLPNPSLPNPSLPNPSLSDSNSTLPGADIDSSENGTNSDGTSADEDKGWIDSLTDFVQSVGDKLDSFTQNAINTLGDIGSSILDGLAEAGQWIADNWEFTAAVVAGVGLTIAGIFVAPLLPFGLAILAGIVISGGIGYFTGLRGEDLTKEMGIGGALGAIGGGVLGIVGKVAGTGLKTLVTGSALIGAITSMADDILHNRKPSIPKAVIGAVLGVGLTVLLVGGQGLANKLMNPGQVAKPSVSSPKVDVQDGACFVAGTPVYTENGFTAIEKVKVGDKVHAYNPETGEKGLKQVNHIFVREIEELVKLNVGKAIIETTPTHPFWVVGNGWVEAGELQTNDKVLLYNGKEEEIGSVDSLPLHEPVKVYNFEVTDWHTYFVSEENVLVHNACWVEPKVGSQANLNNINDFIAGNKKFEDVIDDYAKLYSTNVNSNLNWSWNKSIPGGENLSIKQKKLIKEAAEKNKYIPKINVIKVEGMKFGFADFESAGVVKETVYLPENMWKLTDVEQFKYLDEVIGGSQTGLTWHHSEVPGKMQLIPTGIHNITTHNGGRTEGMWADAPRK